MKLFIFLSMMFLHIIDDFVLQSQCLSNLKQKQWWKHNISITDDYEMYKNDYLMALFMHAFSWTFMILLPIAIYNKFNIDILFIVAFILNCMLHFMIDDLKANKKKISLVADQSLHMFQISATALLLLID